MAGNFCPAEAGFVAAGRPALLFPGLSAAVDAAHGSFNAAHVAITHRCGLLIPGERFRVLPDVWDAEATGCNWINTSYSD